MVDRWAMFSNNINMLEEDIEIYFAHSASLRVMNASACHVEIEEVTGLKPSHVHQKGEIVAEASKRSWTNDIWLLSSPLDSKVEPSEHLNWLWQQVGSMSPLQAN